MKKSNKVYLEDIARAVKLIEEYVKGFDIKKFKKDKKTQDAVIRQIAIIGEAIKKLSKSFAKSHPDLPIKEAVAMRNVLVHDYDWVDANEIWRTIKKDLPNLKNLIQDILENESPQELLL